MYFFYSVCFKPHVNPTVINENIKEIHILVERGDPGISNFKSHASLACYMIPMVWRLSVVRASTISKDFSSETAWPIKAKFYVEPPWVGRTKVCSQHLGHITMVAATPIYGKNP